MAALTARADTINFDSISPMSNAPGSSVPDSAKLSDQFLASNGVRFSSESDFVAVVLLGAGHATSGANGIGGVNAAGALNYNSPITVTFFLPSDPSILAMTNSVSISRDLIPIQGNYTLEAFDADGNSLGSVTQPEIGNPTLSLSFEGIHSVRISEGSGTIAFDDLTFGTLTAVTTPPPSTVPEPATMLLLGTGLAGIGGVIRRKRQGKEK